MGLNSPGQPNRRKRPRDDDQERELVNPYTALHVRQDATPLEIRDAYRRLALWHHPGRKNRDLTPSELQRRYDVFTILAASYEALIDTGTRQMFDQLVRQAFHGEVWVGGKPLSLSLSKSSSQYPCTLDALGKEKQHHDELVVPALVETASSDSDEHEDDDTDPLALIIQARGGRAVSDPYDVFEGVFGSRPFDRVACQPFVGKTARRPAMLSSSAWTGSSRTLQDGSVVSTTCRILHDRKLTRTELLAPNAGGPKRLLVTVTGEDLVGDDGESTVSNFVCCIDDWIETMKFCLNCFTVQHGNTLSSG
jgi:curved DNA-binding protein CbpA